MVLKSSENLCFSDYFMDRGEEVNWPISSQCSHFIASVFRGYKMGRLAQNELNLLNIRSWERSLSYWITCSFLVKSTEATRLKHRTEINLWVWKISCDYFYQSLSQLHVMLNYFLINLTIYVVNLSTLSDGKAIFFFLYTVVHIIWNRHR